MAEKFDDDIAKWRAERRAKYPSVKNIDEEKTNQSLGDSNGDGKSSSKGDKKFKNYGKISLLDKMFLTDVTTQEDRLIQCLQILHGSF